MLSLDIFSIPWILAFCVVLFAAFIRGVSGFGCALILGPILILLMNPKSAVVVNVILAMISNVVVLPHGLRHVYWKGTIPMAVSTIPGVIIGAWIISIILPSTLKIVIGAVVMVSSIPLILGINRAFMKERLACGVSGFLSGLLGTATGLGGPPVVLLMHNQNWPKETIQFSLAAFFLFTTLCSFIALIMSGIVEMQTVITAASLAPALIIGTWVGLRTFHKLNQRFFKVLTLVIIICAGILGIIAGFGLIS